MPSLITRLTIRLASIRAERGASTVEYGLLLAFIAAAIIAGAAALGGPLSTGFEKVADLLP